MTGNDGPRPSRRGMSNPLKSLLVGKPGPHFLLPRVYLSLMNPHKDRFPTHIVNQPRSPGLAVNMKVIYFRPHSGLPHVIPPGLACI